MEESQQLIIFKLSVTKMQSCSNCENAYDATRYVPRILISCGHTACQICIQRTIEEEIEAMQQTQPKPTKSSTMKSQPFSSGGRKLIKTQSSSVTPQNLVFECFECGIPCTIDPKLGVNALPKNMVLIQAAAQASLDTADLSTGATKAISKTTNMTQSHENVGLGGTSTAHKPYQNANSNDEGSNSLLLIDDDDLSNSMLQQQKEDATSCRLHPTKKLEAFCEKDFKLLCIDCILSERHKNHEIIHIPKASEKHQSFLKQQQEASLQTAQKLIASKNEINRHMQLMKLQAEANRRELSLLYNAIRDMLIQREQALKTYLSEVYQREEAQCKVKIVQIDDTLVHIEEYEDVLSSARCENDIDLLKSYSVRKQLVTQFTTNTQIKELQQLNVASFGLAIGPQSKLKKAMDDEIPPFMSLQEIKKDSEQLQVSKIINPNFKGQLTNCQGILPHSRSFEERSSTLHQQHTAASSLKVNKRQTFTTIQEKNSDKKEDSEAHQQHQRQFNQYRRGNTNVTAATTTNASPKPGENKRRQTYTNTLNSKNQGQTTRQQQQNSSNQATNLASRTHSHNLINNGLSAAGHQSKEPASSRENHINLFNQIKGGSTNQQNRRNAQATASQRLAQTRQQTTLQQSVNSQQISLIDDQSIDMKRLTQTNSDKQLLKVGRQGTDDSARKKQQLGGGANGSNTGGTVVKRHQRVAQEKQISDDLIKVQNQVNQVMSNLETFESKKRQLSAKKQENSRTGYKMFERSSPTTLKLAAGGDSTFKQKIQIGNSQRPLTNMLHKRNSSSVCNNDSLILNSNNNDSQLLEPGLVGGVRGSSRVMSPPAKLQMAATQQPRQPAADNVIGNISIGDKTAGDEDADLNKKGYSKSVVTIQLGGGNQQQRQLEDPNPPITLKDEGSSDYGAGDDSGLSEHEDSQRERPNVSQVRTSARNRIKSPIVRIDLNPSDEDEESGKKIVTDAEEHIANLPEIHNDSMVGDLNQLINDLNNGKSSARAAKFKNPTINPHNDNTNSNNAPQDVGTKGNSSFDKQAKALYFDIGSGAHEGKVAKTVDFVESSEYTAGGSASSSGGGGDGIQKNMQQVSSQDKMKVQVNKQKYIEQSVKAIQLTYNISAAENGSLSSPRKQQPYNHAATKSRDRSRDASQPRSSRQQQNNHNIVPELHLSNIACLSNLEEKQSYNLLKSERSGGDPDSQLLPTTTAQEENKLQASENIEGAFMSENEGKIALLTNQSANENANQLLLGQNTIFSGGSSSAGYSIGDSISQASIDPLKALGQLREEYIFVFSGFNERKLTQCEVFDAQRGIWKEIAQIQNPRTKFGAVPISKTRILIFGGKQADGQRTADIEEYNLKNNNFKTLPFKMPKARSGFAACIKKEEARIYFCGGNSGSGSNGSVLRKFDCLDLKKGKWTRLSDMLMKRDELSVAFGPDGNIYAIGGFGGGLNSQQATPNITSLGTQEGNEGPEQPGDNTQQADQFCQCLREAERFNFSTQAWEMLPMMKESRRALAAVVLPDGIYAIGGYDGRQYLATVEKFDLVRQEWVYVKSMNTARCTLSAVASSDCQYIYVLGGYNGKALNLVERYSVMSDTWELMPPMNVKRFMHQSVTLLRQEL